MYDLFIYIYIQLINLNRKILLIQIYLVYFLFPFPNYIDSYISYNYRPCSSSNSSKVVNVTTIILKDDSHYYYHFFLLLLLLLLVSRFLPASCLYFAFQLAFDSLILKHPNIILWPKRLLTIIILAQPNALFIIR